MLDWKQLMAQWSTELMTTDLGHEVDVKAGARNWLGGSPAAPESIVELETRLGIPLPPSYRAFLEISDGWGRLDSFIGRLRPAAEVDWFLRENESWCDAFSEQRHKVDASYLAYTDDGIETELCGTHLKHLVQVSDVEDGVIVLNPRIQSDDGEWEAWFFANWVPGARRYASFAHLMLSTFRLFRDVEKLTSTGFEIPTVPIPAPAEFKHTKAAQRKPRSKASTASRMADSWDELVQRLAADIDRPDRKLLRSLEGKLAGRPSAKRNAALTERLSDIFRRSQNAQVRALCVAGITELAPDGDPPPVLRDAYEDEDISVMLTAAYSHHWFRQPDAVELFCRLVNREMHPSWRESIFHMLGGLRDATAIPTLEKFLLDTTNTFDQTFNSVGVALGQIGAASFDVLSRAATHADRRVRLAATVGLDVCGDPRAWPLLDRLADDPDPAIATRAKHRIGWSLFK
jgi:hypothetical protein